MSFHITHRTRYRYHSNVVSGYSEARLLPRDEPDQAVRSSTLTVVPEPADVRERHDYFGNRVTFFTIHEPHSTLEVTATSEVDVVHGDPPFNLLGPSWDDAVEHLRTSEAPDLLEAREFRLDSPLVRRSPTLADYARPSFPPARPLVECVVDLSSRVHADFAYDPTATTIGTSIDELLAMRRGVCQDFAHVMIGCLRSLGLAARYTSGYLETHPPPGQPRQVGADASHAWVSVLVPDVGWVDVDPTNDVLVSDRHATLAWGRDFTDVTPLKGVVFAGGGAQELTVEVDVVRR